MPAHANTYTNAEFTNFIDAPCYSGQSPAQGCVVGPLVSDPSITRASQDLTGARTALAPEWTGAFGANHHVPIGDALTFETTINARYSEYFLNGCNNPLAVQDSYTSIDATIALGTGNEHWQIALIDKSVTDEYVLTSALEAPNTGVNTGLHSAVVADQLGTPHRH